MLAVTLALALVPSAALAEPPGPPDAAERLRQAVEALDRADQAVAAEDFSLFDRLANLIAHGTLRSVAEQLRQAARANVAEQSERLAEQARAGGWPAPDPGRAPDDALVAAAGRRWDLAMRLAGERDPSRRLAIEAQLEAAAAAQEAERERFEAALADGWEPALDQDEDPGEQLSRLAGERATLAQAVHEDGGQDARAATEAELDVARARQAVAERRYAEAVAAGWRPALVHGLRDAPPDRAVEAAMHELGHLGRRVPPAGPAAADVRAALDAKLAVARARLAEATRRLDEALAAGWRPPPGQLTGLAPDDGAERAARELLVARRRQARAQPGSDDQTVETAALELARARHQAALGRLRLRLANGWRPPTAEQGGADPDTETRKLARARAALASPSVQADPDLLAYFQTVAETAEARLVAAGRVEAPGPPPPLAAFDEELAAARVAGLRAELDGEQAQADPGLRAWLQARLEAAEQVLAEAREIAEIDVSEGAGVLRRLLDQLGSRSASRAELTEQDRQWWIATLTEALGSDEAASSPALRDWLQARLREAGGADPATTAGPTDGGGGGGSGPTPEAQQREQPEPEAQQPEQPASAPERPAPEEEQRQRAVGEGAVNSLAAALTQGQRSDGMDMPTVAPPAITSDPGLCSRGVLAFCPAPVQEPGQQPLSGTVDQAGRMTVPEPAPSIVADPVPPQEDLILSTPVEQPVPKVVVCGLGGVTAFCPDGADLTKGLELPGWPAGQPRGTPSGLGGWLSEPAWSSPEPQCPPMVC